MPDRKTIEARIAELRGELARAEGRPTEVYSRIVGYYRSVRNWNAGKREEYGQRLVFEMPAAGRLPSAEASAPRSAAPAAAATAPPSRPAGMATPVGAALPDGQPLRDGSHDRDSSHARDSSHVRDGLLVFTREACPNCSPVANYVIASGIRATFVDVDRDEGLALARDYGVMATPTVLGLDGEGRESFRAYDLAGLSSRCDPAAPSRGQRGGGLSGIA